MKTVNHKMLVLSEKTIEIRREWSMPSKNTFSITPIKELIHRELMEGIILDPFANNSSIREVMGNQIYITNDIDEEYSTDFHLDALEFFRQFQNHSVDMILYDPPYSPRQVAESYKALHQAVNFETTQASYWSKQKREIGRIVKSGGKVITFGWNSGGIGKKYGFEIRKILLVAHGGWHNDTICTVEVKK